MRHRTALDRLLQADIGRHTGIGDVEVHHRAAGTNRAEQADALRCRIVRREHQAVDGEALAVQAAGEGIVALLVDAADRGKSVRAPHAGFAELAGEIDVVGEHVVRTQIHRHELELVRVADSGRVLHPQERPGLAVDHEPGGLGAAEAKASVARLRARIVGRKAGGAAVGAVIPADAGRGSARTLVPVHAGNVAPIAGAPNRAAEERADVWAVLPGSDRAGGIGIIYRAAEPPDQPAGRGGTPRGRSRRNRDVAESIGVPDRCV